MKWVPKAVLVVVDATQKDLLICYGHDRPITPTIGRIAADGIHLEQTIATSNWVSPTHGSMFTGSYPLRHGVFNSKLSLNHEGPTVAGGQVYYAYSLFEELVSVPLIFESPEGHHADGRALSGDESHNLASLTDIVSMICEWAGIESPTGTQGQNITSDSDRDTVVAEYDRPQPSGRDRMLKTYDGFEEYDRRLQAVRTTDYKRIRTTTGDETLYRARNRKETPVENDEVKRRLSGRVGEVVGKIPDGGHDEELDYYVKEHKKDGTSVARVPNERSVKHRIIDPKRPGSSRQTALERDLSPSKNPITESVNPQTKPVLGGES